MTKFNVINHIIIELIREIYLYKIIGCRLADLKVQVSNISAHVTSTVIYFVATVIVYPVIIAKVTKNKCYKIRVQHLQCKLLNFWGNSLQSS